MPAPRSGAAGAGSPPPTLAGLGAAVGAIPLTRPAGRPWWAAFALAVALVGFSALADPGDLDAPGTSEALAQAIDGAGRAWWIGIACGSLLVSGVLLLLGAAWRGAGARAAETVALLATLAATLHPAADPGRAGGPSGSPLPWDAVGMTALLAVCLSLWSVGLLPDLATLRDRARGAARLSPARGLAGLRARAYGLLACGWRGSAAHWQVWAETYRVLALLGVLIAVTVQTGAALALAGAPAPGWHGTLLPVRCLVDAVASGVGVTAAVVVAVRRVHGLDAIVTVHHLDVFGRLMLCLACAGAYCTAVEGIDVALARPLSVARGPADWVAALCLVVPGQALWSARARAAPAVIAGVGLLAAAGAYAGRVGILAVPVLPAPILPAPILSAPILAGPVRASPPALPLAAVADAPGWPALAGSLGLFLMLLLLCLRTLPAVSIVEIRRTGPVQGPEAGGPATATADAHRGPGPDGTSPWGIAASFETQADLVAALQALSGMAPADVRLDGHGPVPLPRVLRALGERVRSVIPYALSGAALGGTACLGVGLLAGPAGASAVGEPPHLWWTALLVPGAACAVAGGCLAVHAALLVLARLPDFGHPALSVPGFGRASDDRFFLTAEARGAGFDPGRIEARLARLPRRAGRPLDMQRIPRQRIPR